MCRPVFTDITSTMAYILQIVPTITDLGDQIHGTETPTGRSAPRRFGRTATMKVFTEEANIALNGWFRLAFEWK